MAHGNDINNKKYYWLKLDRHFFGNARIKKLRRLAGGDTYTIIYLKLQLLSIEYNGILIYEEIEDSFEKEMALKIEEAEDDVTVTINFLKQQGLLLEQNGDAFLPEAASSVGSETKNNVYKKTKRLEIFQPNSNQIPIEKEIEIDIDKDIDITTINSSYGETPTNDTNESDKKTLKRFKKPTLGEIDKYIQDNNYIISSQRFFDYYQSCGWVVGKNKPMKDWQATVRGWEAREKKEQKDDGKVKEDYSFYDN